MTQVEKIQKAMREKLRTVRKAEKLSQTEMAKLLKLDQSALSRVESGKQNLSVETWIRFRLQFGVKEVSYE